MNETEEYREIAYDLHLHSCLSPCADNDMTPANIAGMAFLNGLKVAALTDHNTCANCPAFFEACRALGVIPVAGMELETAEEIHLVCLFDGLADALTFSDAVETHRMPIPNRPEIFGDQLIMNAQDEVIGREKHLLIAATDLALSDAAALARAHGGIVYPAHIDRQANGIISILGDIPPEPGFTAAELHEAQQRAAYADRYPLLQQMSFVSSSDAHHLWDISEGENTLPLSHAADPDGIAGEDAVRRRLFAHLKHENE